MSRLALRAYPPSFRARYGAELAALTEDLGPGPRTSADLWLGAARAWLRPVFTGPDAGRARLQATVATTWVAWCAGFLIAPTVDRAILDPPLPGVDPSVHPLLNAANTLFGVGWLLVALATVPLVVRAVWPALRRRDWAALRPLLPTAVLGVLAALGLGALAVLRGPSPADPSVWWRVLAVLWAVCFAGFVVALGFGPAASLVRLEVSRPNLRLPAVLAVALAVVLTLLTAAAALAAATAGDGAMFGSRAPVYVGLVVAGLASLVAVVSAARGTLALLRAR